MKQIKKYGSSFLLALIAIILVVSAVLTVLRYQNQTTARAQERAYQALKDSAAEQVSLFNATLEGQYGSLEVMADAMTHTGGADFEISARRVSALVSATGFTRIMAVDAEGTAYPPEGQSINVSDRQYFQECMGGVEAIEFVPAGRVDGTPKFVIAAPIIRDGDVVGAVAASYNVDVFQDLLINTAYSGQGYSFVCDGDGNILVDSDNSDFANRDENLLVTLGRSKILSGQSLDTIKTSIGQGEPFVALYSLENEHRYAVCQPIGVRDWMLFNVVPHYAVASEVTAFARIGYRMIARIGVIALLLTLLILYVGRRRASALQQEQKLLQLSDERFRIATENTSISLWDYDFETSSIIQKGSSIEQHGFGEVIPNVPESLIERGFVHPDSAEAFREMYRKLSAGDERAEGIFRIQTADRTGWWYEHIRYKTIFDNHGHPIRAIGISTDVTKEKELELAYNKELSIQQAMITDIFAQALYDTTTGEQLTFLSKDERQRSVFFGLPLTEFNQKAAELVLDDTAIHQFILNQTSKEFKLHFLSGETEYSIDYKQKFPEQETRWMRYSTHLMENPTTGHLMAFLYLRDIDEQKRREEDLQKAADTDSLTGLYNHAGTINRVKQYLKEHPSKSAGTLFAVDLDAFKSINDTLGHQCGDDTITKIGKSLLGLFRSEDIIGRVGGDEFLIFMKNISDEAAVAKKANELVNTLQIEFSANGHTLSLSSSIGVAIHKSGENFESLYGRADAALYQAKSRGRRCYHIEGMDEAVLAGSASLIQQGVPGVHLHTLLENMDGGIMLIEVGPLLKTLYISPSFYKTTGLTRERVSPDGRSLLDMIVPEDRAGFEAGIREGASQGTVVDYSYRIVDAKETRAWRHMRAVRMDYGGNSAPVMLTIITDISEMKRNSSLLSAVFKNFPVGIALYQIDSGYKPLLVNDALLSMTGLTRTSFLEANKINAFSLVDPDDADRVKHEVDIGIKEQRTIETTFRASSNRNGENYHLQARAVVLTDVGSAPVLLAMYQDITQQEIANDELRQRANIDPLTGLYNREAFFEKAEEMIAGQPRARYVMAYFDIDGFKLINDQYGSKVGDMVLQHVAQVFYRDIHFAGGICCRVSADIFATLYPYSFIASKEMESIHQRACRTNCLDKPLSFSVGRYVVDDITLPVSAMYDRAAMAAATVKGRYDIHIAVYDESMREQVLREQELTSEMNGALESGQFEVWLQPQFNHSSGSLIGAEALVRWRHPQKGLIPPGVFIPVFERNGFVYEVDKYVWEQSCALLRKWLDEGRTPLPISVNISRYDIFRDDFYDKLTGLIKKYDISVKLLRLEITESAFAQASEQIIEMVERLKGFGFAIEIDDFGSGYSSLNTLKDVPADVLKLDMKFLEAGKNSGRGGNIIESVVRMAKWLGMPIIAEGVEDKQQADYLKSIGCNYVQGYLYAKPMPVAQYELFAGNSGKEQKITSLETVDHLDNNAFWDPRSMETLIFNSYVGGACIFEYKDGKIEMLRINRKYVQEFGNSNFSTEEVLKLQIKDYLDEKTKKELNTALLRAGKNGDEFTTDLWLSGLPATPKRVCMRATLRRIARADERMLFYCSIENVTAQKNAEKSLIESAKQLSFLNDVSRDLLFSGDSDQAVNSILQKTLDYFMGDRAYVFEVDWNKKLTRNTYEICAKGISAEISRLQNVALEATAVWFDAFEHKNHISIGDVSMLDEQRTEERHILLQQGIKSLVAVPLRRDGKLIGFMGVDNPSINQSHVEHLEALGDYMAVVLTRRDLNAEIAGDYDTRIRLMEDMPGGFARMRVLSESNIQLEYVNEGMGKMLGMTHAEVIETYGKDALYGVHPDDRAAVSTAIREMLQNGKIGNLRYRLIHGDGSYGWVVIFGRATKDTTGNVFLNVYYSDATEQ